MKGDEDIDDVRSVKNGDERAFARLFEKYRVPLYSICYRYTRNEDDAREITQDVFIKVYRGIAKFNEQAKFFTWVYRIAVNACLSFKRKNGRVPAAVLPPCRAADELRLDERTGMKIAIDRAIARVPERQRLTFILRHHHGYSYQEISSIMRITTGAAKANYHQAVRKLRAYLGEYL